MNSSTHARLALTPYERSPRRHSRLRFAHLVFRLAFGVTYHAVRMHYRVVLATEVPSNCRHTSRMRGLQGAVKVVASGRR